MDTLIKEIDRECFCNKEFDTIEETKMYFGLFNQNNDCEKDNLNIFHSNIRSIYKNFEELEYTLHEFNNTMDIIVLSETFIVEKGRFGLDEYTTHYNESKLNRNDGVMIFVRDNITHTAKSIQIEK